MKIEKIRQFATSGINNSAIQNNKPEDVNYFFFNLNLYFFLLTLVL